MRKHLFILFILALAITSCDSYLDKHQKYLEGGEIVYLQKIDSIATYSGKERLQFRLWYINGNTLTKTVVYYNNYKDSIILDIKDKLKQGRDSIDVIKQLPEASYNFEIVNYNRFNQKSLPVSHFASVYGESYQSTLRNRILKRGVWANDSTSFTVEWLSPFDNYEKVELEYKSPSGLKVATANKESSITIPEASVDNQFRYRTFYRPERNAIDVFITDWTETIMLVKR